jgi:hypothetical protein
MNMREPKVGDIIGYKSSLTEKQYGIIAKLPYGEIIHVEWFVPAKTELIGNKISIWGYGEIWHIAN